MRFETKEALSGDAGVGWNSVVASVVPGDREGQTEKDVHEARNSSGWEPGTYWILTAFPVSTFVSLAKSPGGHQVRGCCHHFWSSVCVAS